MPSGAETLTQSSQIKPVAASSSMPVSQDAHQISRFLLHLTEINIYIAIQAVLDALDIWLSAIKYVFDALNPSSSNASAAQMYSWLVTPDGLVVFILGSVFFALFSFCGNYFDSKNKKSESSIAYQFSKCADSVWPYVRDCFKGLKWTFKGTRSFILVSQMLFNLKLTSYITPFGIGLGILAAINRGWNRGMVERRKSLQTNNDNFREHVKFINAGFAEVDEKWMRNFAHLGEEFKSLYVGSVIKVKRQIETNPGEFQLKYDYFYVKTNSQATNIFTSQSNQETYQLVPLLKEISEQELSEYKITPASHHGLSYLCNGKLYHFINEQCYVDEDLPPELRANLLTKQESNLIQNLHVNEISSKTDFYHYKKQLDGNRIPAQSKLRDILRMKQNYLDNVTNPESSSFRQFYDFPTFQSDSKRAYASSLLNGLLNSPYYFLGVLSLFLKEISLSFFPYAIAICSFFMALNLVAELYQEFDYQRRLKISENKAKLSMIKRLVSVEWDKINQLIDDSIRLKKEENPANLKGSVPIPENMVTANSFEIIFKDIVIKLIEKQRLDTRFLPKELENIDELQAKLELLINQEKHDANPNNLLTYAFSAKSQQDLIGCIKRLSVYYKDFNDYKGYLKNNLVLDKQATFMQGIKNGLHIYGVFNGCMMAVVTMAFLSGGSLGIAFLYVSIGVGLTLVPITTLLTVLLSNDKDKALHAIENDTQAITPTQRELAEFRKDQEQDHVPFWVPDGVLSTILDERDIRPSKNLMISEQCEVFRQFLSGMKKGVKFLQTILMFGAGVFDDPSVLFKALYVGIGLIYGALFSLKGLRGLMRVDNQAYENSLLVGGFFSHKKREDKSHLLEQDSPVKTPLPHFNSALDASVRRCSLFPATI